MKKGILWLGVTGLLVLALVLSSCAPAPVGEQEEEVKKEVGEEEEEEEEEEEVVVVPGEPQYGGTITWLSRRPDADVISWDPDDNVWYTSMQLGNMYELLMRPDYSKGRTGTGEFDYGGRYKSPEMLEGGYGIAESWYQPDPATVIFNIRPGVMFPAKPRIGLDEPRELTADDIVYALERADASDRVDSATRIIIESVEALDRYTVQVNMPAFDANWPYRLGWSKRMFYAPEAAEAGLGDWRNALGTGAYQVVDYVEGSGIWFDKNPVFWLDDYVMPDGKEYQLPFADHFVYAIIADESSQIAALRTGKVDGARMVKWQYHATLFATSPDMNTWESAGFGAITIGLRLDTEPFTDRNVRLALSAALDRDAIINQIYGGYATMLNMPYPASWPETLYTPLDELKADTQRSYTYDPEWAIELLADAGYPDGFKTEMLMESTEVFFSIMSLAVDNWAAIGVEVELQPTDAGTVRGYISSLTHPAMLAWDDSSATPASAMTSYIERGFTNIIIMRDPYVEATFDAALAEPDEVAQAKLWKAVGAYVVDDAGFIMIPGENFVTYAWPWIKNYEGETRPTYNNSSWAFQFAWVDQVLKADMGY